MTQAFHHDYPYRLRLQHPDAAELRLERKGRFFRIDPAEAPADDDVVILTSAARARATAEAVRDGRKPTLVAVQALVDALGLGTAPPTEVDGVRIDALPYTAPRVARPLSHFVRASVRGARPGATLRRLAEQTRLPTVDPVVLQLTFEDGARLLHLDLSLHAGTTEAWMDRAVAFGGNAEWMIVGCPWGEGEAVARLVPRFAPKRVLVTELINSERRELGLPTELVTPLRDRLHTAGIEAHVFATQASYRFE